MEAKMTLRNVFIAFFGGVLATPVLADTYRSSLDYFCQDQGYEGTACICAQEAFFAKATELGLSDDAAQMAALMVGQPRMDPLVFTSRLQEMDRSLMVDAIPATSQLVIHAEQSCRAVQDPQFISIDGNRSPKERFLQACGFMTGGEAEEMAICDCQADAYASRFDDETFHLITELTEIEASGEAGAQDPMEYLLTEKRGLSSDEANQFLGKHRATMMLIVPISFECASAELGAEVGNLLGAMDHGN
ncbi:hypothetical protein J7382_11670 [Shimia sp. R11_0]|uniref:hypothetical protein n=1 Tax=Shimia sp. R11_0 TaxID=2821096 RepID=UPI001ADD0F17|nr:hypothetical protein [Shimia sp. R11_0]MBO9478194.1 hypothetical protein [Shimia sp. R11_0]